MRALYGSQDGRRYPFTHNFGMHGGNSGASPNEDWKIRPTGGFPAHCR